MERFRLRVRHEPKRGQIWELYLFPQHPHRPLREGLDELPSEVVLYWFTLCFYGYRQSAGRAALRTFLTHEEPAEQDEEDAVIRQRKRPRETEPTLFSMTRSDLSGENQAGHAADMAAEPSGIEMQSVAADAASGMKQQRQSVRRGAVEGSHITPQKMGQEEIQ
jgi:hypothetical protein